MAAPPPSLVGASFAGDMVPDYAAMRKVVLMAEARDLGVQTRREVVKSDGAKHRTWRPLAEVAADCKTAWERKHETAGAPAANASQHLPPSPPTPQPSGSDSAAAIHSGSDPQPSAARDIASLSALDLRQECQRAGIPIKNVQWAKSGQKSHVYLPKGDLAQKLAKHKQPSLERFFSRKPGAAPAEPGEAS